MTQEQTMRGIITDIYYDWAGEDMVARGDFDEDITRIVASLKSLIGERVVGKDEEMVGKLSTYGDTAYQSNAVRFGYNIAKAEARTKLEVL